MGAITPKLKTNNFVGKAVDYFSETLDKRIKKLSVGT